MKVTYNWLRDFVDLESISAEEVAKRLTASGFEVEETIYMNEHLHDVYVGKITKIEKHPEADKLQICQVNVGEKNVQIITSATNVFEGAVVPVSLDGADLVMVLKSSLQILEVLEVKVCSARVKRLALMRIILRVLVSMEF